MIQIQIEGSLPVPLKKLVGQTDIKSKKLLCVSLQLFSILRTKH